MAPSLSHLLQDGVGVEEVLRNHLNFTISELLGRPNPEIEYTARKKKRTTTKSDDWVQISADDITKLDGFTDANLGLMFEDLLQQRVTLTPLEFMGLRVTQRGNDWVFNRHVLSLALWPWAEANAVLCVNKTVARLQDRLGAPRKTYRLVPQFRGDRCAIPIGQGPGQTKHLHANWLFSFPADWTAEGLDDLVDVDMVGQVKAPRSFDPTDVAFINPADEDAWEAPPPEVTAANWCLRQCGTYAWETGCRYMILVTADYVTVLRFHLVAAGDEGDPVSSTVLGVEYEYFPYSSRGGQGLPLCKVIWALMLMAQHPGHRDIVPRRRTLPLNTWYAYKTAAGRTYYVHHISEIVRDSAPGNEPKIVDISKARDRDLIQRIARRVGEVGR